jgi:hypothetical protein
MGIASCLGSSALTIWEQQVRAIYKIQRLPDGVEVDFYMREGAGRRPAPLPRFRRCDAPELHVMAQLTNEASAFIGGAVTSDRR